MADSSIPLAIDALLTAINAGAAFTGVKVFDGPRVTPDDLVNKDRIYVGDSVENEPAVEGEESAAHADMISRDEAYSIVVTAESWAGDTNMKARRDRAFALKNAVGALLRPSVPGGPEPTLGGVVMWSEVAGGISLVQRQASTGAIASVTFHVYCRART